MSKYLTIIITFLIFLAGVFYLLPLKSFVYKKEGLKISDDFKKEEEKKEKITDLPISPVSDISSTSVENLGKIKINKASTTEEVEKNKVVKNILFNVPFTSQAPSGDWSNPVFQDGCEEASSLMAVRWALGKKLTAEEAKEEIIKISDYEKNNFGEYRDTSIDDTAERIIKGYFSYEKFTIKENIAVNDIVAELIKGSLVIAPLNGQKLNNPHYTPPGPEMHMVVIIGYDIKTKEFIVNDPGTRLGASYRYAENVLYSALRDYKTGHHELIEKEEKTIIIISR